MADYYIEPESDDDVFILAMKKKVFDDLDKARRYILQHICPASGDVMVHVFEIVNNSDGRSFNHIGDVWATHSYHWGDFKYDFLWCPHGSEESDRVPGISPSGKLNKILYRLTRGDPYEKQHKVSG